MAIVLLFFGAFLSIQKFQQANLLQLHNSHFERELRDFSADAQHLEIMLSEPTNLDHLKSFGQSDQSSPPVLYNSIMCTITHLPLGYLHLHHLCSIPSVKDNVEPFQGP